MKKLFTILLLALFAVAFTSCAEDPIDTEPVVPEINEAVMQELQQDKSTVAERTRRKAQRTKVGD